VSDTPGKVEGAETARRALRLIEAVTTAAEPIGLTELASSTGLSKSTCYRLVRVLQEELYVDRVEPDRAKAIEEEVLALDTAQDFVSDRAARTAGHRRSGLMSPLWNRCLPESHLPHA
jgi:DNA-binding IclR family transcriptional regulator